MTIVHERSCRSLHGREIVHSRPCAVRPVATRPMPCDSSGLQAVDLATSSNVRPAQDDAVRVHEFWGAFRRLTTSQREILVLTLLHGLSYQDVGAMLGCSAGMVRDCVDCARRQLRHMLLDDVASSLRILPDGYSSEIN